MTDVSLCIAWSEACVVLSDKLSYDSSLSLKTVGQGGQTRRKLGLLHKQALQVPGGGEDVRVIATCLLYTSPRPRDS